MKTFKQFMKNELKLNESGAQEGEGDILWHTSSREKMPGGKFAPLAHFGTQQAVKDFSRVHKKTSKRTYAVRIRHGKSFQIDDPKNYAHSDSGVDSPVGLLYHLHQKGMFNHKEYKQHIGEISKIQKEKLDWKDYYHRTRYYIADAIRSKGYDSLHYKNEVEDPGSISHVITHPDQIRILKSRKYYRYLPFLTFSKIKEN